MNDFIGGMLVGIILGVVGLLFIASIADGQAERICRNQDWVGASCQCRLIDHLDLKPTK